MIQIVLILISTVIFLFAGAVLGYITAKREKAKIQKLIQQADLLQAKQRAQLLSKENRLEKRQEELENNAQYLRSKIHKVKKLQQELTKIIDQELQKLTKITGLSEKKAKEELFHHIEEKYEQEITHILQKIETQSKEKLEQRARDIMAQAIERYASSQSAESTTSSVTLLNEELKGRIIGKEGRNIHYLEKLTGCEIIIDDTPEAITISGFNPVRRQVAKIALEKLIADGRIHPARIERVVEKAKELIKDKIKQAGESAVYETGIIGLDSRLIEILGRLCFRTSYGQNALLHSIEVAHLAGAMAEELGADVETAKKAGLLHDIGKSIDREIEGTHVEIGRKILSKFNVSEKVIEAMQAHHGEYEAKTVEALIVKAADAISGARPGARKDTLENYLKRLSELEKIASVFPVVEKAYAIDAGRELRVFVKAEQTNDLSAKRLAEKIATNIENELKYPGEIKVNVIRETRVIEYAR